MIHAGKVECTIYPTFNISGDNMHFSTIYCNNEAVEICYIVDTA